MAKIQDIQVQQQEKDRPIWGSKARVPSQARSCMSKWPAEAISWKIARLAYEADVENQIIYQGSIVQLVGSSRTLPNMKH
ncbi:hypothetical protein KY290_024844 [Solanum tuberosum]|uniref:Uncharacterized protein n=1 Tax=Solanum tuberosum TaxID=4113 RepID=A0ABQ7URV5_SOLTU|nr:hypothetical protein KY284_023696 [Solanum tuberosum]KAH0754574.1 hypothetical protein KY290_024844 [Solanum tuberosum]